MTADTFDLITRYYAAFNAADMETFLSLLTDDVVHDINQGERETGEVIAVRCIGMFLYEPP